MRWRRKRNPNYGEERQLISPGPKRCLANTLLCMKRKWQTLFYREVNTEMLTFTKLTEINSFESERKIINIHGRI